jgi:putative sterol carrier protein
MAEILSDEWASAWGEALNASASYRTAAASWEGAVVVAVRPEPARGVESRAVFLDLWRGACREARAAAPADEAVARYVLTADAATWVRVLSGALDPLAAVMSGALELTKGSVGSLLPHVAAAKELVAVARGLRGSPPPTWPAA